MEKFGRWPFALLGFGFFVSTVYQYGFWSVFELNVFQYFNPADMLKNFLYVIMSGISPIFVILFLIQSFDEKFLKIGERFERRTPESIFGPDGTTTWGKLIKVFAQEPVTWASLATVISGFILSYHIGEPFEKYPIFLIYFFVFAFSAFVATSTTFDFIGFPSVR